MTELKEKLIEAIRSIDFTKLNIYELRTVAEITEMVDRLDFQLRPACGFSSSIVPKTIGELKEG